MSSYEENPETDGKTAFSISQLQAMHLARAAWDSVTPTTIANCWKHTGILQHSNEDELVQNNLIASSITQDKDLDDIVEKTKETLSRLSQYPGIPESSPRVRISIQDLLNPVAKSKLVHDSVPIPTNEEIVNHVRGVEVEQENIEQEDESNQEPEREPWSLSKMRAALNEIEFGLLSQPASDSSPSWLPHVKSLQSLRSQLIDAQWSGLKQTTLDTFFQ
ncbi:hypothetical protein PCASD_20185 [Puccinia coronata f. sp. avenae]|uniref:DDE-1 domain-containing protein n=1 Tax=Puccinia coronata f. sp. avenae TaxID=200324 RepID=A0A2N5TMD5_9BASI|nr:hypothetical protein PCASD_20185 [Puccinia coronata f. sp. avenae]